MLSVEGVLLSEHASWYLSRASGIVAWGLATLTVVLGLLFSARTTVPKPAWALALHRHSGALCCWTVLSHVFLLLGDKWLNPSVRSLVVVGAMQWRGTAVAFGQIGLYLLLLVQLSGFLQKRVSKRLWHVWHLLSVPAWILSTMHYITAGSDTKGFGGYVAWAGVGVVAATTTWRLGAREGRKERKRSVPSGRATTDVTPQSSSDVAKRLEELQKKRSTRAQ